MTAKCPRCGEEMTGGICDNCGFPLTKMRKKHSRSKVKNGIGIETGDCHEKNSNP